MKFALVFFYTILISKGFACESFLKDYKSDCELADQYSQLKNDYAHFNIDPINLKLTLLPLLYGEKTFTNNKYNVNLEFDKNFSKIDNNFNLTFNLVKNLNKNILTLDDVLIIHKSLSKNSPGKIRSSFGITRPRLNFNCTSKYLTELQINNVKETDLLDEDRLPYLKIENMQKCSNENQFQGELSFIKGAKVRSEMERWIIDFNDALKRYELSIPMPQSPSEYIIHMSRWFSAIHPFLENNEEVAYFLAYYATNRLKLSPIYIDPKTYYFLYTKDDTIAEVLNTTNYKIKNYKDCLFEIIDTHISAECMSIK